MEMREWGACFLAEWPAGVWHKKQMAQFGSAPLERAGLPVPRIRGPVEGILGLGYGYWLLLPSLLPGHAGVPLVSAGAWGDAVHLHSLCAPSGSLFPSGCLFQGQNSWCLALKRPSEARLCPPNPSPPPSQCTLAHLLGGLGSGISWGADKLLWILLCQICQFLSQHPSCQEGIRTSNSV